MGTVAAMLAQARSCIGMGEPGNKIQKWYARRNGNAFAGNFAWCEASLTYWAYYSGNHEAVCPKGDRAYTVWGADDWRAAGSTWYPGTAENLRSHCRPGAKVYFDWGGSNTLGLVDHVGVCEKNLGDGRIQTIEGNTGDVCARRVRSANVVAGFWNPRYGGEGEPVPAAAVEVLARGDAGAGVVALQRALMAAGYDLPRFGADGDFGDETEGALRAFQQAAHLRVDGEYGPASRKALAAAKTAPKTAPKTAAKGAPKSAAEDAPRVPNGSPVLRTGSTGKRVAALQRALIAAGHALPSFGPDGQFGAETAQAVRALQRQARISADGQFGPKSSAALKAALKGKGTKT